MLVLNDRVISTGYNGTPADMENCEDGGCVRCDKRDTFGQGEGYDKCICVHAEQNAILSAARFGISVDGSSLYTTIKPCFSCAKAVLQAGVKNLFYREEWKRQESDDLVLQYEVILARFKKKQQVEVEDPYEAPVA